HRTDSGPPGHQRREGPRCRRPCKRIRRRPAATQLPRAPEHQCTYWTRPRSLTMLPRGHAGEGHFADARSPALTTLTRLSRLDAPIFEARHRMQSPRLPGAAAETQRLKTNMNSVHPWARTPPASGHARVQPIVYVVDDDAAVRESLQLLATGA